jgi:hypothetical protein
MGGAREFRATSRSLFLREMISMTYPFVRDSRKCLKFLRLLFWVPTTPTKHIVQPQLEERSVYLSSSPESPFHCNSSQ